jgi:4-amino-4-deoxy-L-arabinose transferase-like glycosyltransferase
LPLGSALMQALKNLWKRDSAAAAALVIGVLVIVRLISVIATPLEIGPDESQYWRWSRVLDFGYYSKPPLMSWLIAVSTAVFGNAEWAIRFFSPLLHGTAAFFLFLLGRRAFDAATGAWAAAIYALMPGVWLSSTIMSTDAVLLPMYAASLYFLWRMRETPRLAWGLGAGIFIGLAILAKYAALYILGGTVLAALFDKEMRKALLSLSGLVMLVAAAVVMAPNLIWNYLHGFETVAHTADNANVGSAGFHPQNILSFLGDQMGVFGPLTMLVLLAGFAFIAGRDPEKRDRDIWLLCYIIPPLVVILGLEIISRAHANHAATAYPAASVLLASWIPRAFTKSGKWRAGPLIKTGVGINAAVGLLILVLWTAPSIGDAIGATNAYKRVRGWEATTEGLAARAKELNATAIMLDEREVWHGLDYYGRDMGLSPVRAWRRGDSPKSHAEEAGAMHPGEDGRVLVASLHHEFEPMIAADFKTIEPAGKLTVPLGPGRTRVLTLFVASGYHPQPRTVEFEKRFETSN